MKKTALMICVLMLFSMAACTDGNVDNNGTNGAGNGTDLNNGVTDNDIVDGNDIINDGNATDNLNKDNNNNNDNNNNKNDNNGNNNGTNKTLRGTAQGYGGEITVTVEVNGDDIVSVRAVGDSETEGVGSNAIEQLPARIEEANSTNVDGVSGATMTSNAIKEAVNKALEENK